MPSKSPKQARIMQAVAHNPEFAKKVGVPQKVGAEFMAADKKLGDAFMRPAVTKPQKRPLKMPQPPTYNRQFSFQNQQSLTPADPLPADELDSELNSIKLTLDATLANLGLIQRDDGELGNETVGVDQLKPELAFVGTDITEIGAARDDAVAAADAAEASEIIASAAAATATGAANTAQTSASDASNAVIAAQAADSTAQTAKTDAETAAFNAQISEANAATSQAAAELAATKLQGTSITLQTISLAPKVFTTQTDKFFDAGMWVLITSDANPDVDYMGGPVTDYTTDQLTVDVRDTGGSGDHTDWTIRVSGIQGVDGVIGGDGVDGTTTLSGSGAPGAGLGADGDFYIDTTAWDIYGPKTGGAWGAGTSLIGAAGADGTTTLSGSGAPGAGLGVDGDFYIDTTAWDIYGPKTGGAWGAGTSLVGPSGAGTGDVVGPAASIDSEIALFSSTTGKVIKRATTTGLLKATSGVVDAATADVDYLTPGTAAGAYQPVDSDLTSIAALTTTAAGRSVLTIADPNADRVVAWDDTASGMAAIALADLTTEAAPAAGDYFLIYGAEGDLRKANWSTLPGGSSGMTDVERQNFALSMIYQSKAFVGYRRMVDFFAAGFKSSDGVDAGASSNYAIDTTNGRVAPTSSGTQVEIVPRASDSAMTSRTYVAVNTFVTNGVTVASIGCYMPSSGTVSVKIAKRNSSTNYDIVVSESFVHPGGGWSDKTLPTPYVVPGSGDYCIGMFTGGLTVGQTATGISRGINAADIGVSSGITFTEASGACPALRYTHSTSINNMTVVTTAQTADTGVSTARALIEYNPVVAITLDTDLTIDLTCDGGAHWTAATLALVTANSQAGRYVAETGAVTCTSGTSFQARIKNLNNKNVQVYGVTVQGAPEVGPSGDPGISLGNSIVVGDASYVVLDDDTAVLISRVAPAATAITLGLEADRAGKTIFLKDISTDVTSHTITVTPSGADKIDGKNSMTFTSNPAVGIGAVLVPSAAAGGWYVL